jgi:hypothetical protein
MRGQVPGPWWIRPPYSLSKSGPIASGTAVPIKQSILDPHDADASAVPVGLRKGSSLLPQSFLRLGRWGLVAAIFQLLHESGA